MLVLIGRSSGVRVSEAGQKAQRRHENACLCPHVSNLPLLFRDQNLILTPGRVEAAHVVVEGQRGVEQARKARTRRRQRSTFIQTGW